MITGGEDGKINSWPIRPVDVEREELMDGEDLMDVDIPSSIGRKRERTEDNELVRFFFSFLESNFFINIICIIARQTSQVLNYQAASQAAHFCQTFEFVVQS